MIIMKKWGGIFCIIILLFAGFLITPAVGSIYDADDIQEGDIVTVYFWDITGNKPTRQIIELAESEWNNFRNQISEVRKTSKSLEESFNSQIDLFKQFGFITYETTYNILEKKAGEKFSNKPFRLPRNALPENVILNAICAINFQLDSGKTFVFGLNTFMNLVGLDIISIHYGNTTNEISTFGGLLAQTAAPGEYVGFMFGFLGYWAGTKTGTGFYSDLIVAGFSVMTAWFPIST